MWKVYGFLKVKGEMRLTKVKILICTLFFSLLFIFGACSDTSGREAEKRVEKGRALAEESRFHDALSEFGAALQYLDDRRIPAPELRMKAYNGLGGISYIFGDTLSAVAYYAKAWRWGKGLADNRARAGLASNLAMAYNSIGKTDSARIYNDSLKSLTRKTKNFPAYQYYFNLGRIEFTSSRWESAVNALDSALIIMCRDYPSGRENSEIYILLAKAYIELGDSAKAFDNAELGDVNAEFEGNDNNKLRAFRNLEGIYRKLGNNVKANAYADRISSLQETIVSHNRLLETGTIDNKDKGQNHIIVVCVTVGILLLVLVLGWVVVRKYRAVKTSAIDNAVPENDRHDIIERLEEIMKETQAFKDADFDISQLSSLAGINTKYISKAINATGRNFRTFVAEYRIELAIRLLTDSGNMGKYTVESVGREVGFKSHSNFIAAFRKVKGTTPSAFLRTQRK